MRRFLPVFLLLAATSLAQEAKEEPTWRVYPLGGLIADVRPDLRRAEDRAFRLLGPWNRQYGEEEALERPHFDAGRIAGALNEILTEATSARIQVSATREHLMVYGTADQHRRAAQVLEILQRQAGEPFEIEVRHLSVQPSEAARAGLDDGVVTDEELKRLAGLDPNGGARGGTFRALHGWWSVYRATREQHYMADFDVEIAQAAAVADPIVRRVTEGVQACVRPFLLQDGRVLLRVFATAGDLATMRRFGIGWAPGTAEVRKSLSAEIGALELPDYLGCFTSTETIVAAGGRAAVVVGTPDRWDVLLFRVSKVPATPPAGTLSVLPIGALAAVDYDRQVGLMVEAGYVTALGEQGSTWRIAAKDLEDLLRWGMGERGGKGFLYRADWLHGGSILARTGANEARMLKATLGTFEREFLRPARVTVRLASDAAGRDVLGLVSGPVVADRRAAFASFRRVDHLRDYDVEVAQEARIADPNVWPAYGGVFANARLSSTGARAWRLELELRVAALEETRVFTAGAPEVPPVQLVPVRTRHLKVPLDLASGAESTIDLGRSPFADGRLYAVVRID